MRGPGVLGDGRKEERKRKRWKWRWGCEDYLSSFLCSRANQAPSWKESEVRADGQIEKNTHQAPFLSASRYILRIYQITNARKPMPAGNSRLNQSKLKRHGLKLKVIITFNPEASIGLESPPKLASIVRFFEDRSGLT